MSPHCALHPKSSCHMFVVSWFCAVTLVSGVALVGAVSKPVYTAVGSNATIECGTEVQQLDFNDVIVDWFDYVHNNESDAINIRNRIKTSSEYRSKFHISPQHSLTISRIQEVDAGSYFCVVRPKAAAATRLNSSVSHYYMVTVYSALQCHGLTSIPEAETAELTCNSTFAGELNPSKMQWLRRDVTSASADVIDSIDLFEIGLAQRSVRVPAVTHDDYGATYSCRMELDAVNECQMVLNVLYSVRHLELTPVKEVYHVGEEIRCSASGNPQPSIVFRPLSGSTKTGPGSMSVFVPDVWLNGSELFELVCTASNTVHGVENVLTKTISFTVIGQKTDEKSPKTAKASSSTPIIIGIVIGVVILVAVLLAVICMRLCKDRKTAKALKTPPPPPPPPAAHKEDLFRNGKDGKVGNRH